MCLVIKQITKEEVQLLIKKGILKNGRKGITDMDDELVGYSKTVHKRYIEDKYVDIVKGLENDALYIKNA